MRFQGFHGGHILIVLDEAPGVLPEIWEALYHHRVTEYERCGTCVEYRQDDVEPHKGFCKWQLMVAYQCEGYLPRAD